MKVKLFLASSEYNDSNDCIQYLVKDIEWQDIDDNQYHYLLSAVHAINKRSRDMKLVVLQQISYDKNPHLLPHNLIADNIKYWADLEKQKREKENLRKKQKFEKLKRELKDDNSSTV